MTNEPSVSKLLTCCPASVRLLISLWAACSSSGWTDLWPLDPSQAPFLLRSSEQAAEQPWKRSILWYSTFYRWTTSFLLSVKNVSEQLNLFYQLDICDLLLVLAETEAVQLVQRCRIKPTATIQRLQSSSGTDFLTPDPPGSQLAVVLTTPLHWGHKHWGEEDAEQLTHPHTVTYS